MENLISGEIKTLSTDIPKISNLLEEYLFSLVCYKYFFNQGDFNFNDYASVFTDGRKDGGIDIIFIQEDSNDQIHLIFIQSKCITDLQNSQDVIDIFTKIDQTVRNFEKNTTAGYNDKLKRLFKEILEDVEDKNPIMDIVVFLGTNLTSNRKKDIQTKIKRIESLEKYHCTIYDKSDINNQIESIKAPKKFVSEAKIKYAIEDGKIKFGNNGLLVNLSANSLKSLYDRFKDEGLFEQNYRYFIRNKKIDDAIKKSLQQNKKDFWFLNNGIILVGNFRICC